MPRIKLIALDLDGTTLNSDHVLTEKTADILRKLDKKGVIVCLATGRGIASIQRYVEELNMGTLNCVAFNGASGVKLGPNNQEPETIFLDTIENGRGRELVEFAQSQGLVAQYYNGKTGDISVVSMNEEHEKQLERYAALVGRRQIRLDSYDPAIKNFDAAKILLLTNDNGADDVMSKVSSKFDKSYFNMIRGSPKPWFVEFLQPGVSKGTGLEKLCKKLKISLDECASFGDGDNDVEMLQKTGYSVAMANGRDVAKEAAQITLEKTNNEDGVALHLLEMEEKGYFDVDVDQHFMEPT